MEELRRALADAKAARLQGTAYIASARSRSNSRSRSRSPSPVKRSSPVRRRRTASRSPDRSSESASERLAEQRKRLADADASALYSRAEQAIEARRRQISSFGAVQQPRASSPERSLSPMLSGVSQGEHDSSWGSDDSTTSSYAGTAAGTGTHGQRSSQRTHSPRSPVTDSIERLREELHVVNDRAERSVSRRDSSLSPQSDGPQRRVFEPVSADQRILDRLEHPERSGSVLEEDWAERGDYTFHPLTGSSRRGPDGKQSVLARAKRYLRQHADLATTASITPDIVERLIAKEVTDGYITAAQARKVSRQVGDAQIMSAFNAIQAASFARRNTPATPKEPKVTDTAGRQATGELSPETRVLLDAGLSMQEVNSLKTVGALGPRLLAAAADGGKRGAASPSRAAPVSASPKNSSKAPNQSARMSPARKRLLAKSKAQEPGGFGRGRSPERPERRARSRPKPRRPAARSQERSSEVEPLEDALHRASAADQARAAAARAAEATISVGLDSPGSLAQSFRRDTTVQPGLATPGTTAVAPPAVDPAFSSFLDRTEEWSVARARKAEEKRLAQDRRAVSAGISKRLHTTELQDLVDETMERQQKWEHR